ncbi:MAG: galactosyltransferase-related protein [Planctomycetota bacterium]
MDALTPPGVEFSAVVVTGTRSVEQPTMKLAVQLDGAVGDVFILHDDDEFVFARRVNRAAHALLERHPDLNALILANDDTIPTALACHRIAAWPKARAFVSAVSNQGGGGAQNARGFFEEGDAETGQPFPSPQRLAAFFLYITADAWKALEGLDEQFDGHGGEDTDLSLRAAALGFQLQIDPLAYVWHEGSASFGRDQLRKQTQRARDCFLQKYPEIKIYTSPMLLPTQDPSEE